jgi:hypothetical protein
MKEENKKKTVKIIVASASILGAAGIGVLIGTKISKGPNASQISELVKENNRLKVEKKLLSLQLIRSRNEMKNAILRIGRLKEQLEKSEQS